MLEHREVEKLVYKFLYNYNKALIKSKGFTNKRILKDPLYFGELITEAYLALSVFDPSLGFKPSTLIFKYCLNRLRDLLRSETAFYSRHKFSSFEHTPYKQKTPYEQIAYEEAKSTLKDSGLSKRTKEIISLSMEHPEETMKELGDRLGVTKQAVSLHIESAKDYFQRNKIEWGVV